MDGSRLRSALTNVEALGAHLDDLTEEQWEQALQLIRREIRIIDESGFFNGGYAIEGQVSVLYLIQNIIYHNTDVGDITQISTWCLEKWLRLLHRHPREVVVLRGIGEYWLLKAKPILARIQENAALEGDSDDPEEPSRHHSADHVEVRGILIPASDYLRRAVERAQRHTTIEGSLLSIAAEAHISLGTVTVGRESQAYFQRAIRYLRAASLLPNYELSEELQRYLDEYGHYVD